jgi:hypothetical protein
MKKILIILFFCYSFAFSEEALQSPLLKNAEKYGVRYTSETKKIILNRDKIVENAPLLSPIIPLSGTNTIKCPNSDTQKIFKNFNKDIIVGDFATDYNINPVTNQYRLECAKYIYNIDEATGWSDFTFVYRYFIDGEASPELKIDTQKVAAEKELIKGYNDGTAVLLDNFKKDAFKKIEGRKDLSSYLTSIFSIDADTIDLGVSAENNRVVKNNSVDEEEFYTTSRIGSLFKFVQKMQKEYNDIASTVMLFALLSLGGAAFFYVLKMKKQTKDQELELPKFMVYFFVGLLSFAPYPANIGEKTIDNQTSYTNLASSSISSIYSISTSASNKIAFITVDSVVENMLYNAGLESEVVKNKLIDEKYALMQKIKIDQNIKNQCESSFDGLNIAINAAQTDSPSVLNIGNNKADFHPLYHHARVKMSAKKDSVSIPLCSNTIPALAENEKKLELIENRLNLIQNTDISKNMKVLKLVKNIYRDLETDGFVSVPNIFVKIMILEKEIKFDLYGQNELKKQEDEIEKISQMGSKNSTIEWLAGKIPLLMMPGADTVLSLSSSAIPLPFIGTAAGVTMATLYGETFLEQLPIYVLYIISSISIMLYYAIMLLYTMLTYVLLAVIFFPKNYEIMQRFFKSVIIHSFKSLILIISVFLTYVLSTFFQNYSKYKSDEMLMQMYNILDDGSILPVPFNVSLLSSLMNVVGVILSSVLIYLLITKASNIVYEALLGEKSSTSDEMETQGENKLKSKGL